MLDYIIITVAVTALIIHIVRRMSIDRMTIDNISDMAILITGSSSGKAHIYGIYNLFMEVKQKKKRNVQKTKQILLLNIACY